MLSPAYPLGTMILKHSRCAYRLLGRRLQSTRAQVRVLPSAQTNMDADTSGSQRKDYKAIIDYRAHFGHLTDPVLMHEDYFGLKSLIDVEQMFRARLHLGHKAGTMHEDMAGFLFGERLGVCVIDLEKTAEYLFRALNFMAHVVYREGVLLFVSAQKFHVHPLEALAKRVGEYAYTREYDPGTFTDSRKRFSTKIRHPDLFIFTHTLNNVFERHWLIHEANMLQIPTIGVVDSNADPGPVTYPIPGNDDSKQSLEYFLRLFETTVMRAKEMRKRDENLEMLE